jgi:hypothetical protein
MRRRLVRIIYPAALGAVLLGGAGWFLGPVWALAGVLVGPLAGYSALLVVAARRQPDPVRLLQAGRPQEAYRWLEVDVTYTRRLAAKRPMFRDVLAFKLETMSRVLQALDNDPRALEAATEAATIFTELTDQQPGSYSGALAGTLLQKAAVLAHMSRHGEALAAIEPAVQIYRRLAVSDRGKYLPPLATALGRKAVELYSLEQITESRTAAAEAEMIRTDMLPSSQG